MTSTTVKVNRALSVPPVPFDLPLASNHRASVTIAPPSAHIGSAPVQMRLISYDLREGQVTSPVFVLQYSVPQIASLWASEELKRSLWVFDQAFSKQVFKLVVQKISKIYAINNYDLQVINLFLMSPKK